MKKILAMILALSMILTCGIVFAEGEDNEAAATIIVKDEDGNIMYEGDFATSVLEDYPDGKFYEITGTVDNYLDFQISNAMLTVNGAVTDTLRMRGGENSAIVSGNVGGKDAISGVNTQDYYDYDAEETIVNTSAVAVSGSVEGAIRGVGAGGESVVAVSDEVKGGLVFEATDQEGAQHTYQLGEGIYATGESLVMAGNDVQGYNSGITAEGNSKVQAFGDVSGGAEDKIEYPDGTSTTTYEGSAVCANGKATVEISGNVNSQNDGITAEDTKKLDPETYEYIPVPNQSTVTVEEDVTTEHGRGIIAESQANVEVGGTVYSADAAIVASGEANVSVGEDVLSLDEGIFATDGAQVTVGGSLGSEAAAITAGDYGSPSEACVSVGGDVLSSSDYGVIAHGDSMVTVGGDVMAYFDGVFADDDASVKIGGSIAAGHETTEEEYPAEIGNGISAFGEASVLVGGDVISTDAGIYAPNAWTTDEETGEEKLVQNDTDVAVSGNVTSEKGSGVLVEGKGEVYIEGDLTAYYYGVVAEESSLVQIGGSIEAGYEEKQEDDEGKEKNRYFGTAVMAAGDSVVGVGGSIESKDDGIFTSESYTYDEETGEWIPVANMVRVAVGGDVKAENGTAVSVSGRSGISISGSITAERGIYGRDEAGEPDESIIYVGGDISASEKQAIKTDGETEIYVGGNVSSEDDSAIEMGPDAKIRVAGDVTGGEKEDEEEDEEADGKDAEDGDKEADKEDTEDKDDEEDEKEEEPSEYEKAYEEAWEKTFDGYSFADDDTDGVVEIRSAETASGELIIEGTLSATGDSVPLVVKMSYDLTEGGEPELSAVPEIKIYEIVPNDGEYFCVDAMLYASDVEVKWTEDGHEYTENVDMSGGYLTADETTEMVEALARSIQYIVKVADNKYGSIDLDGVTYDEDNDLMLAREDDEIGVTVTAKKGYRISGVKAGDVAEVIDNKDGTWTVIVKRGGGVTISAKIKHRAEGKLITYGHYDFDGDGTKEDLVWRCLNAGNGYARLALEEGLDSIPDDFEKEGFTEYEMTGIRDGEITELSEDETKRFFKDGKIHPVIIVRLDRIKY